jgi:Ni,Fe-hydrogenase III small subunit
MVFIKLLQKLLFPPQVTERADIFLSEKKQQDECEIIGAELKKTIQKLYHGRALRIRQVDGGSTNGEEIEMTALGNAYYDIERFGLSFVASPRHADILFVSGPITRNLETAVRTTYEAAPQPCIVVAVGDGACTGGIWKDSYAVVGPVEAVIPVDIRIPGDPPSPTAMLRGILQAIASTKS